MPLIIGGLTGALRRAGSLSGVLFNPSTTRSWLKFDHHFVKLRSWPLSAVRLKRVVSKKKPGMPGFF